MFCLICRCHLFYMSHNFPFNLVSVSSLTKNYNCSVTSSISLCVLGPEDGANDWWWLWKQWSIHSWSYWKGAKSISIINKKREECSGIDDLVMHHYKVLGVFLFLDIGYDIRDLNCEARQYVKQCRNTYLVSINKNLFHSDVWCALLTSVYGLWT